MKIFYSQDPVSVGMLGLLPAPQLFSITAEGRRDHVCIFLVGSLKQQGTIDQFRMKLFVYFSMFGIEM